MPAETAASPTLLIAIVSGSFALIGALIGAAIGAAATLRTNSLNIKIENITKERAKWRDNVREKALWVHKAAVAKDVTALGEHHLAFTLILSPIDLEDRSILSLILKLRTTADELHLRELADRVSLLLKHDWQRAKWEAEGKKGDEPPRMGYAEFKRDFPTEAMTIPA